MSRPAPDGGRRRPRGGARSGRSTAAERFVIGGRRAVLEALVAGRAVDVLLADGSTGGATVDDIRTRAEAAGVSARTVPRADLDELGLGEHQGVAATVRLPPELDERALAGQAFDDDALAVILDGITDPQNLGAAARGAEAAGAALLVTRRDRSASVTPAAVKASAGALLHLPVARVTNLARAIDTLKEKRFSVVGLDHRAERTIHDRAPDRPLAIAVGAEGTGLSRLVRERCDWLVSIPMRGRVGSLNAAAALSVALFAYANRP